MAAEVEYLTANGDGSTAAVVLCACAIPCDDISVDRNGLVSDVYPKAFPWAGASRSLTGR
jgi:hypothetical protein